MIKAVVVVIKNDEFEYLVLKRHKNHKFSEQWCLPGGKVDFLIDQNRWELEEEAAFRELKEETGLKPLYLYKDKKHSY
jgi:ADP-ribose pyrophosphatase YjhB (NUDIX family)